MPAETKPLFRPEALRPRLAAFTLPPIASKARAKLTRWANLLASKAVDDLKETELRDEFIFDVFRDLLGYISVVETSTGYTLKKESLIQVDGTFADAAFGRFAPDRDEFVAVLEGKGPGDKLDRPYKSRKRSAVEQAMLYAVQLRIDWYLVTNLKETRLYHKGHDTFTRETFETARLAADDAELRRFVFLLGAERVVGAPGKNHLDDLLAESARIGRELTDDYYSAAVSVISFIPVLSVGVVTPPCDGLGSQGMGSWLVRLGWAGPVLRSAAGVAETTARRRVTSRPGVPRPQPGTP
jgi:hypothetical protein